MRSCPRNSRNRARAFTQPVCMCKNSENASAEVVLTPQKNEEDTATGRRTPDSPLTVYVVRIICAYRWSCRPVTVVHLRFCATFSYAVFSFHNLNSFDFETSKLNPLANSSSGCRILMTNGRMMTTRDTHVSLVGHLGPGLCPHLSTIP